MLYIANQDKQMIQAYHKRVLAPNGLQIFKKRLERFPDSYVLERGLLDFSPTYLAEGDIQHRQDDTARKVLGCYYSDMDMEYAVFYELYRNKYPFTLSFLNGDEESSIELRHVFPTPEDLKLHIKRIRYLLRGGENGREMLAKMYPDFSAFCKSLSYVALESQEEISFSKSKGNIVLAQDNADVMQLALSYHPREY